MSENKGTQLDILTGKFWKVCQAYYRGKPKMTTEKAIKDLGTILKNTNPCRPVSQAAAKIQDEIIIGDPTEEDNANV